MQISLKEHGGFAAVVQMRRPALTVDVDALGAPALARMRELVASARQSGPPSQKRPGIDAMSYTITVNDEGREEVLRLGEASMTPAAADLIDFVKLHGTA